MLLPVMQIKKGLVLAESQRIIKTKARNNIYENANKNTDCFDDQPRNIEFYELISSLYLTC